MVNDREPESSAYQTGCQHGYAGDQIDEVLIRDAEYRRGLQDGLNPWSR